MLTAEAKAIAKETGIAAGWEQPDGLTYIIRCQACGLGDRHTLTQVELSAAKFPIEDTVEEHVRAEFAQAAEQAGCPHWPAFLSLSPSKRREIGWGVLLSIMDRPGATG